MKSALDFSDIIFTGGSGRSGTTIMGKMLGRHPEVQASIPLEIKFLTSGNGLLDLVENRKFHKGGKPVLGKNGNLRKFENGVLVKWWSRESKQGNTVGLHQGIGRDLLEEFISQLRIDIEIDREKAAREFFRKFVDVQMDQRKRSRWVDTTPPNLMRSSAISELLPGAKFIHMIRDGRDVACSVVLEKWGPDEHFEALEWWRKRLLIVLDEVKKNPDSVLHVWLEELIYHERDKTFHRIADFVELSESPQMYSYFNEEMQPRSAHSERWRSEVSKAKKFSARYEEILEELISNGLPAPMKQL